MNDAQKLIENVLRKSYPLPGNDVHETVAAEIDKALGGLTRETRTNAMSSSGMTTNYNTGEVISYSDIRRDVRWVSGWSEAQP